MMTFPQKIISLIQENSDKAGDITPETDIWKDIQIDSLDFLMIVDAIEDEFNIAITDEAVKKVRTISALCAKLEEMFPGISDEYRG
ncbi:MAG: acyl carrier protein [Candidatus Marinimicrobia bacterium]|nr:acyl carrier protein [Candidatus Neomarinimicrobiota bacterium]